MAINLVNPNLNSPAIAILGPRQLGKTTLAKQLKSEGEDVVYLDMENPGDQVKLTDANSYLSRFENSRVIIDEIQLIKLSNAPLISKGSLSCAEDLKPKYKFIITPESDTYPMANGVIVISLKDFLEKSLPGIK